MNIDDLDIDTSTVGDATGAVVFPQCMVRRMNEETVTRLKELGFKDVQGALIFGEVVIDAE